MLYLVTQTQTVCILSKSCFQRVVQTNTHFGIQESTRRINGSLSYAPQMDQCMRISCCRSTIAAKLRAPSPPSVEPPRSAPSSGPGRLHRGAQGGATELRLAVAWSFGSDGYVGEEMGRRRRAMMKVPSCFQITPSTSIDAHFTVHDAKSGMDQKKWSWR
jgi:hypothetical protein